MPKKLSNDIPQGYPICNHASREMPASEQRTVLEALHKAGIEKGIEFDSYEESYNWYNK